MLAIRRTVVGSSAGLSSVENLVIGIKWHYSTVVQIPLLDAIRTTETRAVVAAMNQKGSESIAFVRLRLLPLLTPYRRPRALRAAGGFSSIR